MYKLPMRLFFSMNYVSLVVLNYNSWCSHACSVTRYKAFNSFRLVLSLIFMPFLFSFNSIFFFSLNFLYIFRHRFPRWFHSYSFAVHSFCCAFYFDFSCLCWLSVVLYILLHRLRHAAREKFFIVSFDRKKQRKKRSKEKNWKNWVK